MAKTFHPEHRSAYASYMLLWNPDYFFWPEDERLETLASIEAGEPAEAQWSMSANHRHVQVGDRVYLRKTGQGDRGIVAAGWVQGEVIMQPHWDGSARAATYVPISWDSLVDVDNPFNLEPISQQFPSGIWRGMQSGMRIPDDATQELERQWQGHFGRALRQEQNRDDVDHDSASPIERRYAVSVIRARRHQKSFRALLLQNRELKCQVDGCPICDLRLLEAAHIVPDSDGGASSLDNGLLLCPNHHRALDVGLIDYDGDEFFWNDEVEPF
ncbi:HNH endonuclease [Brevibacterium sp. CSND-B09]|uniref:HNH endonuclease n=1 Tax=Brevibacterium sp. CSND-B09 TaxID=3462571 RepID=UPI00406A9B55